MAEVAPLLENEGGLHSNTSSEVSAVGEISADQVKLKTTKNRTSRSAQQRRFWHQQLKAENARLNALSKKSKAGLNLLFIRRFWILLRIMLPWPLINQLSLWLLLILFFLIIGATISNSLMAIALGNYAGALVTKDQSLIFFYVSAVALCIFVWVVVSTLVQLLNGYISILWRKKLAIHITNMYLRKRNYYVLQLSDAIDNPDIRMTTDLINFTTLIVNIISQVFSAVSVLITSTIMLVMLHPLVPITLFIFFFAVFVVLSFVMSVISKYVYRQEILEGDFRFSHIRLRTFAESIAFLNGEWRECGHLDRIFRFVIWNAKKVVFWTLMLNVVLTFVSTFTPNFHIIFFALFLFTPLGNSVLPPGTPIALITAFSTQLNTVIANWLSGVTSLTGTDASRTGLSKQVSEMIGYCFRIAELIEVMQRLEKEHDSYVSLCGPEVMVDAEDGFEDNSDLPHSITDDKDLLRLQDVACSTPVGERLFSNVSFSIKRGQNVVVMGASGCGKSSLLRLIGGLWRLDEGHIEKPDTIGYQGIFFLPQRSYMFLGTLRDQITYPSTSFEDWEFVANLADQELLRILQMVNLDYVVDRYGGWDTEQDWSTVLSIGEQQRLGMARLFYHKPALAILDEATSAVDQDMEAKFYRTLKSLGITFVSVAHRPSVKQFHEFLLKFDPSQKTYNMTTLVQDVVDQQAPVASSPSTPEDFGSDLMQLLQEGGENMPTTVMRQELHNERMKTVSVKKRHSSRVITENDQNTVHNENPTKIDHPPKEREHRVDQQSLNKSAFNLLFIVRFFRIMWISFDSPIRSPALLFVAVSCILSLISSVIGTFLSIFTPEIIFAIISKDLRGFLTNGGALVCLVVVKFLSDNAVNYLMGMTQVKWRESLCRHIQTKHYLCNKNYYKLQVTNRAIDNADMRITQDILGYFEQMTMIITKTLPSIIMIVMATIILGNTFVFIPIIIFAIYIVQTILLRFAMAVVAKYVYRQEVVEADYRFAMCRIRALFTESIAFLGGERQERLHLNHLLGLAISNSKKLLLRQTILLNPIVFFTFQLSLNVGYFIFVPIVLIPWFGWHDLPGDVLFSRIMQVVSLSIILISSLLTISNLAQNLAALGGMQLRIAELIEVLKQEEKLQKQFDENAAHQEDESQEALEGEEDAIVKVANVQCLTPGGECLFKNLNFSIRKNESVVVMGESGAGKTSLLRLIGGLWRYSEGRIIKPERIGHLGMFYLPQKPYLFEGSLRDQVTYPVQSTSKTDGGKDDDQFETKSAEDNLLLQILESVSLTYIVHRYGGLDSVHDWSTKLSLGEQQRLAMARLFFHQPRFAVLDEATSAVDAEAEERFYTRCRTLGITYLSVAHNKNVMQFHTFVLRLVKNDPSRRVTDGCSSFTMERLIEDIKQERNDHQFL